MENRLPIAVITGGENFVARELMGALQDKGMKVEIIGETVERLDEVKGNIKYFFDFGGGERDWGEAAARGIKLCVVKIDEEGGEDAANSLKVIGGNWRVVRAMNVYGQGMGDKNFLWEILCQAGANKNLRMPGLTKKFRILHSRDVVEAVIRASIISGTEGGVYQLAGDEVGSKELAEVLIDEAKMTRLSVIQEKIDIGEINEDAVRETWRVLRWKPEVGLREGMKDVVREAVMRVDEEGRKKKSNKGKGEVKMVSDRERRERFEAVVVEEEKTDEPAIEEESESEEELEIENEPETREEEVLVEEDETEVVEEENVEEEAEGIEDGTGEVGGGEFVWGGIEPLLTKKRDEEKEVSEEKQIEEPKKDKKVTILKKIKWWWVVAGILGSSLGMMVWPILGVILSTTKLTEPIKLMEENRNKEALQRINLYKVRNEKARDFLEGSGLNKIPGLARIVELSGVTDGVLDIEEQLVSISMSLEKVNSAVFEDGMIDWKKELENIKGDLQGVELGGGIMAGKLASVKTWIPGRWKANIERETQGLKEKIEMVGKMRGVLQVLPEFLGIDGKRREYLVLLQNETELRATGGFIGSYGILSFEGGKLLSFEIKDVYEADGQLKGHVEPPEEIKKFLGEAGWFMRDANWQPSFPQAAIELQWFFEKETGRKVDGVIGMNLAVAKMILGVTGEIYVPDFKEKVNKDNLYSQAEYWSETKFFPGSVQKASFLSGVGKQLFEEVKGLKSTKRWELANGMVQMLDRNELIIAFNNTGAAAVMAGLGWDGAIYEGKCNSEQCYADYLYLVESNFGVNKANYFVYRGMEQAVVMGSGEISRTLRVSYENTAKNNSWPGGDYKNYARFYIPQDARVVEVIISQDGTQRNLPTTEIKTRSVFGKKEVGFLVMVPVTKKVVVELKYSSSVKNMGDSFSYLQYIQRQPGFGDTALVTLITLPDGWQVTQVQPTASMVGGKVLFNQKFDRDLRMGIEISK